MCIYIYIYVQIYNDIFSKHFILFAHPEVIKLCSDQRARMCVTGQKKCSNNKQLRKKKVANVIPAKELVLWLLGHCKTTNRPAAGEIKKVSRCTLIYIYIFKNSPTKQKLTRARISPLFYFYFFTTCH